MSIIINQKEIERAYLNQLLKQQDECDTEMVNLIDAVENAVNTFDEDNLYQALCNLRKESKKIRKIKRRLRDAMSNIRTPSILEILILGEDNKCFSTDSEDQIEYSLIPRGLEIYRTIVIRRRILSTMGITDRNIQNQYLDKLEEFNL